MTSPTTCGARSRRVMSRSGIVTIFVVGSTAGITTIEFEPGAIADLNRLFDRLAPRGADYQHHLRWGDDNGSSHVRAALLGPSITVPFTDSDSTSAPGSRSCCWSSTLARVSAK